MAYDKARAQVVLFGGADAEKVCNDTWIWEGRQWQQVRSSGPQGRTFPAMAYDDTEHRVLLFGGNTVLFGNDDAAPTFLQDLWAWDGEQWILLKAEGAVPPPRAEASMAFDRKRSRLVLFGGYNVAQSEINRLGDTWEWDGMAWRLVSTEGPSPRNGAAMVYDQARERIVLFGGPTNRAGAGDTWEWDGVAWHQVVSGKTAGRFNSAMAYDEARGHTIRFGGWDGHKRVADTWKYDGVAWEKIEVQGPEPRNHTTTVYDSKRKKILLFGGHDGPRVLGDTWAWDGRQWLLLTIQEPRMRVDNGH